VADDDGHIREVVRYALEKAGHDVMEARDGVEALRLAGEADLVVLDIIMPGEDGLAVCRDLEGRVPIIFLTSRAEEVDRVLGLELGADDYVTKPFSPRELVARVKAVLRRLARSDEEDAVIEHRGLKLDLDQHRCFVIRSEIELTVTEFDLLRTMMSTPGKAFSRSELVDRVWGRDHHVTERTIDSHVRRIRKKLLEAGSDDLIETVHGLGYRMRA